MILWWFIAFVIFIVIELLTINLVTVWFAVGAFASLITSIFYDSCVVELIVFIIVSLLSLIISQPIIRKFKVKDVIPTNLDRVIGSSGYVVKKITKDSNGQVKVLGSLWTAISDSEINEGKKVKVLKIDGVKLVVEEEE